MSATGQHLRDSFSFRPLTDALILGAMRAGTTFLHDALSVHPGVASGPVKEYQFFSYRWPEGLRAYRRQLPRRWPSAVVNATGFNRPLVIDSSPYYLFHPLGARARGGRLRLRHEGDRAAAGAGRARMVALPAVAAARAEHLGFMDAIAAEDERLAGEEERIAAGHEMARAPHQIFSYIARGRYAEQLERWRKHLPRDRFLLLRERRLVWLSASHF